MSREPFKSFAQRIVRNGEVQEFMEALIEEGVPPSTLKRITATIEQEENDRKDDRFFIGSNIYPHQ